jgi:hypothetical protein
MIDGGLCNRPSPSRLPASSRSVIKNAVGHRVGESRYFFAISQTQSRRPSDRERQCFACRTAAASEKLAIATARWPDRGRRSLAWRADRREHDASAAAHRRLSRRQAALFFDDGRVGRVSLLPSAFALLRALRSLLASDLDDAVVTRLWWNTWSQIGGTVQPTFAGRRSR